MTIHQVAAETALTDLPDRIVVSPEHGRLVMSPSRRYTTEGEVVRAGEVICVVESGSSSVEVLAPCDAWVLAFLARDGERVGPGAPLVHLREL
ncbi:MAG: lipoyl domain-containing protein [Actinomycetota bacterium]